MHKSVPTSYKLLGHLRVRHLKYIFIVVTLSSIDCGCNQCFHLVPVSCHSKCTITVCVSYIALYCCQVKKKCVLYYRIHIEFACSEAFFKSAILMHSDLRIIFLFNN